MTNTYVVTGASGRLGRRAADLLLDAGAALIAVTRTPDAPTDLAARGARLRRADFDDPASLITAFEDADRLLLVSTDTLGADGRRVRQHQAAVRAAEAAGVRHVVYTSFLHAPDSPLAVARDHAATEAVLETSSLGFTLLRNAFYMEMLLDTLPPALASGVLSWASGEGRIAYVAREDCARAAAQALLDGFEGRRALDIVGPQALSGEDVARIASEVFGAPIAWRPTTPQGRRDQLAALGLPPGLAAVMAAIDEGVAARAMDSASRDLERLTGRPGQSVAEFLRAHRNALMPQG